MTLLYGNFDEENDDSGVVNLVKNITEKFKLILTSGNSNETQSRRGLNVMKSLNKNGSGDMSNPLNMFNQMMHSGMMAGLDPENSQLVNEAADIVNSGTPVPK